MELALLTLFILAVAVLSGRSVLRHRRTAALITGGLGQQRRPLTFHELEDVTGLRDQDLLTPLMEAVHAGAVAVALDPDLGTVFQLPDPGPTPA